MAAGVSVKSVVISGVGSIGLLAIQVARAAGALSIYAVDVNPARLALAKRLGADGTFEARGDAVAEVKRLTGDGADVLLEMSGSGTAIDAGLQMLRNGGRSLPSHVTGFCDKSAVNRSSFSFSSKAFVQR